VQTLLQQSGAVASVQGTPAPKQTPFAGSCAVVGSAQCSVARPWSIQVALPQQPLTPSPLHRSPAGWQVVFTALQVWATQLLEQHWALVRHFWLSCVQIAPPAVVPSHAREQASVALRHGCPSATHRAPHVPD